MRNERGLQVGAAPRHLSRVAPSFIAESALVPLAWAVQAAIAARWAVHERRRALMRQAELAWRGAVASLWFF